MMKASYVFVFAVVLIGHSVLALCAPAQASQKTFRTFRCVARSSLETLQFTVVSNEGILIDQVSRSLCVGRGGIELNSGGLWLSASPSRAHEYSAFEYQDEFIGFYMSIPAEVIHGKELERFSVDYEFQYESDGGTTGVPRTLNCTKK